MVPARGGSRRLARKNLRQVGGRSLIERAADALAEAALDAPCILTTDDAEIAEAGRAVGWQVPFLRPADLARDDTSTEATVRHALDWFVETSGEAPEFLLTVQVTSPLRRGRHFVQALDLLRNRPDADGVLGVAEAHIVARHHYLLEESGLLRRISDAPTVPYVPNGALYLVRTAAFCREHTLVPEKTLALKMSKEESVDIDTENDLAVAETLLDRTHAIGTV